MNDSRPATVGPRRYQFSLRGVLLLVTACSLLLAIAVQFPQHSIFLATMTCLLLLPLAIASGLRSICVRLGLMANAWMWDLPGSRELRYRSLPARTLRVLGLTHTLDCPPLSAAALVAVIYSLVVVALWPVIREVGLQCAIVAYKPEVYSVEWSLRSITGAFSDRGYWLRLWQWECWALTRWWLLFTMMLGLWLTISAPFSRQPSGQRWICPLARLLTFAPWLVVLEVSFLIGVWVRSPMTVPEPSTGFVVGIFSWDLWHWDCWLNHDWLVRGAIPTLLAGFVFFQRVMRWPGSLALVAAAILIPLALMLSIASTVAYQHGLPWLSWA
jgi:hypothetical protein